jgi:hypothetical protein
MIKPKVTPVMKFMNRHLVLMLMLVGAIATLGSSCDSKSVDSLPITVTEAIKPSLPQPSYLQPVTDPISSTIVTRVSDQAAFESNLPALRHVYSKNQPWNADESYLLLNFKYPAALLDGQTYQFIRWVRQPSQSVWSNISPSILYGLEANTNHFVKLDLAQADRYTVLHKFTEYDRIDFGQWNGNLSNDDRYAALAGIKAGKLDLLIYDLLTDQVIARTTQPPGTIERSTSIRNHQIITARIDSVSMSPSGKYVVLQYHQAGKGANRGIHLLDRSLKFVRQLSQVGGSHYDSCVNSTGAETIVVQDDLTSAIVSVDYSTGKKTTLLPAAQSNYNIHISCRNLNRPGWVYISEFAGTPDPNWKARDRTFALKLDGSGSIEQFASPNHSRNQAYERQPHSVPNRNGTKVIFASDWGNPTDPVYSYISTRQSRRLP